MSLRMAKFLLLIEGGNFKKIRENLFVWLCTIEFKRCKKQVINPQNAERGRTKEEIMKTLRFQLQATWKMMILLTKGKGKGGSVGGAGITDGLDIAVPQSAEISKRKYPEGNRKCMKGGKKEVKEYRYGSGSERDDHQTYETE